VPISWLGIERKSKNGICADPVTLIPLGLMAALSASGPLLPTVLPRAVSSGTVAPEERPPRRPIHV
jgi:hypothetical protein